MDKYLAQKILNKDIRDNVVFENSPAYKEAMKTNVNNAKLLLEEFISDNKLNGYIRVGDMAEDIMVNISEYLLFYSVEEAKEELNNTMDSLFNQPIFIGCYKDAVDRDLPNDLGDNTLEKAHEIAKEKGYKYFGMQYPQSRSGIDIAGIHAGDTYGKHGIGDCANSKKNSDGEYTGGVWLNAVYKVV